MLGDEERKADRCVVWQVRDGHCGAAGMEGAFSLMCAERDRYK